MRVAPPLVTSCVYYGTLCAPYLSINGELGEVEEGISHFPVPQEMFTPKISAIRSVYLPDVRVDLSTELYLYATGFARHGVQSVRRHSTGQLGRPPSAPR